MLRLESVLKLDSISFSLFKEPISKSVPTVLSSAKQSDLSVSLLLSCLKGDIGTIGPGLNLGGCIFFIFASSSILNNRICAAKLYSRGEGLSPYACPFPRLKISPMVPCPKMMHAVLPVPMDLSQFFILYPNPQKLYTFSMKV